jgi:hypothetical protein
MNPKRRVSCESKWNHLRRNVNFETIDSIETFIGEIRKDNEVLEFCAGQIEALQEQIQ